MPSAKAITAHARVLALRLRLGLADLKEIESWADGAILADGAPPELADLCLATRAGVRITQRILDDLGGTPSGADVMRALAALDVEAATQDDLRRLADNLDPTMKQLERAGDMPPVLSHAAGFANAFWLARMNGAEALAALEERVRDVFQTVQEFAAELPEQSAREESAPARRVSAIVVSYHTGETLLECLQALAEDAAIDEIVLVNNGNPVAMIERVEEMFVGSSKLKLTGGGVNRGFAAGVNLGAREATGDRLLIINPDAILQPGSISALELAMSGAAEPAIAGGKIFGLDGREQRGGRRRRLTMRSAIATFLPFGWLRAINPGFVSINRNEEPEPSGPSSMDAVSGAFMYVSRTGFQRLGGFDEGYFMHVEDVDLCRRAEADGGSVVYTPHAAALHHGATSDAPSIFVERHKAAGLSRYFLKFAETPLQKAAAGVLGPLIGLILVTRARLRKR